MGTMNPGGAPNQGGYQPPPQAQASSGLQQNVAAALCYLFGVVSGVIFLVLEPYNKDRLIRFHAFQSIFLWLSMFVIFIALGILSSILAFIPFVGWIGSIIGIVLFPIVGLGVFCVWLYMMYKSYNNQRVVLPVIGPLAEKQA